MSRNPSLPAEGIDVHPDALSREAMRERAWRALEPHYLARLAGLVPAERREPARDDRLDDVAEAALRNGGQVIVVPEARMPTRTGIAAIYRY